MSGKTFFNIIIFAGTMFLSQIIFARLTTVAVDSDGKTVLTGGSNCAVFVINPDTLTVKERIWVGHPVKMVSFNKDNSRIAVTTSNELKIFDAKTYQQIGSEKLRGDTAFACPSADIVATKNHSNIEIHSLSDGKLIRKIDMPKEYGQILGFNISPDGKQLVTYLKEKSSKENKVPQSKWPKELKDRFDKDVYGQKNDGSSSVLLFFDVSDGKLVKTVKTWITISNSDLAINGENVTIFQYSNFNAVVDKDGKTTPFQHDQFCSYGRGMSADHKQLLAGSLGDIEIFPAKGEKGAKFKVDQRVGGWPEYFNGLTMANDGTVYAVSGAYRIMKVSPDRKTVKLAPVY